MKRIILIVVLSGFCLFLHAQFPQAEISNKLIHARFYLPDPEQGYYRSTRFDWAGVMPVLEYKGHSFLGQWNETYDPILHDAIMGPVEEFAPLGYNDAKVNGNFVKIGVGVLRKPDEPKYNKFNYYQIEDHGIWKVKKKSDQVSFIQTLKHQEYSYDYEKTVKLIPGKPVLEISHKLINRGLRVIETTVYNHNFFVFDTIHIGIGTIVKFPFAIKFDEQRIGNFLEINDKTIAVKKQLFKGDIIGLGAITGYSDSSKDFDIRIENQKAGTGVRITGDQAISRMIFWGMYKTICPEPYININIEPGKEFEWKLTFEFYQLGS